MDIEITPEQAEDISKIFGEHILSTLPPEERLKGLEPQDRIKGLEPQDRIKGLELQDLLKGHKPEEIRAYLDQLEKKND